MEYQWTMIKKVRRIVTTHLRHTIGLSPMKTAKATVCETLKLENTILQGMKLPQRLCKVMRQPIWQGR